MDYEPGPSTSYSEPSYSYDLSAHYEPEPSTSSSEPTFSQSETPELLQKKLYFLLEQLQNMARDLPPKYQMRLPYELLTSLANSLLNETVFEIVKGLLEIQNVTEQHLYQQRLQFINMKKLEEQEILKTFENDPDRKIEELGKFISRQKEDLKKFDMNLVLELDQKVIDQQQTLEAAGIPGFYVTKTPIEIKLQMHLLDFLLRISRMKMPS